MSLTVIPWGHEIRVVLGVVTLLLLPPGRVTTGFLGACTLAVLVAVSIVLMIIIAGTPLVWRRSLVHPSPHVFVIGCTTFVVVRFSFAARVVARIRIVHTTSTGSFGDHTLVIVVAVASSIR